MINGELMLQHVTREEHKTPTTGDLPYFCSRLPLVIVAVVFILFQLIINLIVIISNLQTKKNLFIFKVIKKREKYFHHVFIF